MAEVQDPLKQKLDVLPAMLNQVLAQTGRILRDSELYSPQNVAIARRRVNDCITPANEKFQNALNDIEAEIIYAKAVIERDLSKMRKKRADRQRDASNTLPSPPPEPSPNVNMTDLTGIVGNGDLPTDTGLVDGTGNLLQGNDFDQNLSDALMQLDDKDLAVAATAGKDNPLTAAANVDLTLDDASGSNTADNEKPNNNNNDNNNNSTTAANNESDTSKAADAADMSDFDALFNESSLGAGGTDNLNFDFDLTGDALGVGGVSGETGGAADEDLDSLLPGLEEFMNASKADESAKDGAAATDTPATDNDASNTAAGVQVQPQPPEMQSLDDTNLNDLFNAADIDIDLGDGDGTGEGGGNGNLERPAGETSTGTADSSKAATANAGAGNAGDAAGGASGGGAGEDTTVAATLEGFDEFSEDWFQNI